MVAEMRTESDTETDIDENAKIEIRSDTRSDSDVAMASPTARDMLPADLTKQVVTCRWHGRTPHSLRMTKAINH